MSDTFGRNVNIFLRSLIKAAGVLYFMFKLSWRLTCVTFIGIPIMIAVWKVYGFYKKLSEDVQDTLAKANHLAEEDCCTMRTVRSFGNEMGEVQRYAENLAVAYKQNKKQAAMFTGYVWLNMLFKLCLTVSLLCYGRKLVIDGALTGGTFISFILYQIQLGDCLNSMDYVYTELMQAAVASEKVFKFIDRQPEIIHNGNLVPDDIQGRIEFKNVCFSYPSRPHVKVLKNISFTVGPGEVVALVGSSDGGKTSCVNLIEYFYRPDSGEVLLDNFPIQEYDHHYLHKQISLVGQEPVLYSRTIEENIMYGLHDNEWNEGAMGIAARRAYAHFFILELPAGYYTQTGDVQMSESQKKRIAIARMLLRKPKVVLLEEDTNSLDSDSEYLVQKALFENLKGKTVIIIAHRLSTLEKVDRIIVIDKGQVVEQGSHSQLLVKKGVYANLVKHQLLISENSLRRENPLTRRKELEEAQGSSCLRLPGSVSKHASKRLSSISETSVQSEDEMGKEKVTFTVGSL